MTKKKVSEGTTDSNKTLATKAQALVTEVLTTLAAGTPLTVKQRKEVTIRTIRITPAFVSIAAATYGKYADILGGDLDADAALAAQDFAVQMTPLATGLRTLSKAFGDRVQEHKATAAEFAQTVYDRVKGMQSMPQGPQLAENLAQLQNAAVKRKRKAKAVTTPAEPTAASTAPASESPAPGTTSK